MNQAKQLAQFCEAVIKVAKDKSAAILKETRDAIKEEQKRESAAARLELEKLTLEDSQKINNEYGKHMGDILQETRGKLIKKRDLLENEIFDNARQKIVHFCAGPEYRAFLTGLCQKAQKEIGNGDVTAKCHPRDESLLSDIFNLLGLDYKAEADSGIKLGGAAFFSQFRVLDETLDKRLDSEREEFSKSSGLILYGERSE